MWPAALSSSSRFTIRTRPSATSTICFCAMVLMVRETPLHTGHLRTMTQLSEMGAIVAPPVPAFYSRPVSLEDMIDHTIGRMLDLFDIEVGVVRRWRQS